MCGRFHSDPSQVTEWHVILFPGLHQILFPSRCLGCSVLHQGLCSQCRKDWIMHAHTSLLKEIPILSSIQYSKTVARILLASKEDGIEEADDLVLEAMLLSTRKLVGLIGKFPTIIPMPSSPSANRRRGRKYVSHLATRLSAIEGIQTCDVLFYSRKVIDQSTLDANARARNLSGAMSVKVRAARIRPVVLLDDLVTSGATFSEAIRVLIDGGYTPVAGITAFLAHPLR